MQGRLCEYNDVLEAGNRMSHSSGSPRPAVSVLLPEAEALHLNVLLSFVEARLKSLVSWLRWKVGIFLVKVFDVETQRVTGRTRAVRI